MSSHMARLKARPRQLEVDPECLRWTPVIVTNTVVSDADGDDDDDEEDDEPGEDNRKEVNTLKLRLLLSGGDGLDWNQSCYTFLLNNYWFYCALFVNRSNQVTRSHQCPGTCAKGRRGRRTTTMTKKRKMRERASWGFPLAKALQHPLPSAVHHLSRNHHDHHPQQMENADHGGAHPKTGLGVR